MAGLGLLFSALSGAGKGLASSAQEEQKVADEQALMKQRSDLEEQKALRIAEATRQANRQAGIQQGQEIQAGTLALQNQRNQADADRINQENANVIGGSNMSAADAASLRTAPDAARKAYGLLSPSSQTDLEDRATAAENLGYLEAAKETRGLLQTEVQNQKYDQQSTDTNRRLDIQEKANKEQMEFNNRMESRRTAVAEAQIKLDKARESGVSARAEKAAADAERNATVSVMKGAETEAKRLQAQMASSDFQMSPPEVQKLVRDQLSEAQNEARTARRKLASVGIEGEQPKAGSPDALWALLNGGKPAAGGKQGGSTVPNPVRADSPAPAQEPARKSTVTPASEEQFKAETAEAAEGKRIRYSEEVKAYLKNKSDAENAASKAARDEAGRAAAAKARRDLGL